MFDRRNLSMGTATSALATADVDGDGRPDLIVALPYPRAVAVLLNDGTGNFVDVRLLPVGMEPMAVETGDVNGDGKVDIVVMGPAGVVVLWNGARP